MAEKESALLFAPQTYCPFKMNTALQVPDIWVILYINVPMCSPTTR